MKKNKISYLATRGGVKIIPLILILILSVGLSACSLTAAEQKVIDPANYGRYGANIAQQLAANFPLRSPGSVQEQKAGDWLIEKFTELGYEVVVMPFQFTDETGQSHASRNLIIRKPGQGFYRQLEDETAKTFRRQAVVGAHYDVFFSQQDLDQFYADLAEEEEAGKKEAILQAGQIREPTLADFNGIHDNASGIGTLLLLARELSSIDLGYDLTIVAFGAGEAGQAGARAFVNRLSQDELSALDVMYCIDSIYAGDKVYAHAGRNSIRSVQKKDYEKRRKLYEATDVYYENELYTNNRYALYTNQSSLEITYEERIAPVMYREWSLNDSDYCPFDEKGVPIVFFESYDYDGKTLADLKESKNPSLSETDGQIRHTFYDASYFISQLMNQQRSSRDLNDDQRIEREDHLTKRINNTAFIIVEALRKGVHDAEMIEASESVKENRS